HPQSFYLLRFSRMLPHSPLPTLFPYTSLFRSQASLSPASYCLILNPAITFYYIMNRQAGNPDILLELLHYPKFYDSNLIIEHWRSEEHTSELQSRFDLVCRLLLEKQKEKNDSI